MISLMKYLFVVKYILHEGPFLMILADIHMVRSENAVVRP